MARSGELLGDKDPWWGLISVRKHAECGPSEAHGGKRVILCQGELLVNSLKLSPSPSLVGMPQLAKLLGAVAEGLLRVMRRLGHAFRPDRTAFPDLIAEHHSSGNNMG